MMKDITVYLADDHTLFRKGMIRLLQSFDCVQHIQEAENGKKLINLIEIKAPDVVLLDLRMPVMDGFDTCKYLKRNYQEVKIIILTMEYGRETIVDLLDKGANGFLSKVAEPEELELAIQTVLVKEYFINEYLTHELIELANNKIKGKLPMRYNHVALSQRELEILRLTCQGLAMRQIASALFISERTVHNHRSNMMHKLNINNANGLVAYALRNQLFDNLSANNLTY